MDISGQSDNKFAFPLPFCSIQALKGLDDAHAKLVRVIFLTQPTDSNANLFQKYPH